MNTRTDYRNREARRSGMTAAPMTDTKQLQMQYGHNGHQVVVLFGIKIDNLAISERQVDEMITCLQDTKAKLIEHKAAAAQAGGPGNG